MPEGRATMLAELREKFLPEFIVETRSRLRIAISQIPPAGKGGKESAESIASLMHTIAGEAMLIGSPGLALLARAAGGAARRYLDTLNDAALVVCARALRSLARSIAELEAEVGPTLMQAAGGQAPTRTAVTESTGLPDAQQPSAPQEKAATPERIRVLVVDDSPLNAALLREGLEREGFDAEALYDDLPRVIERMETFRPQALFLDFVMPGCDPGELARCIKSNPALSAVQILLVTSLPEPEALGHARSMGAATAVSKELGVPEIVRRLRALLAVEKKT